MSPAYGWLDRLVGRLGPRYYLFLAVVFTVGVLADVAYFHFSDLLKQRAYDVMMRHRLHPPAPDADIVIVDIDEKSLAAMAGEYGRWPWPRQVLGEFLEQIERQQPKAVVFDILFSDPDVYNPDSDAYFDQAVGASGNTFFPMLRLPPQGDAVSRIKAGALPGAQPVPDEPPGEQTLAVLLPHFPAVLQSGRIGFYNIEPDEDGVARHYRYYRDEYGWRLPSLPLRLGQAQGWPAPRQESALLNWRGPAFSYRYVSFHDVYADFLSKERRRPLDEFRGKIVVIGSTAPSLFDVKATPMARQFPGVEVLATAIDNLKRGDYLKAPAGRIPYALVGLIVVWAVALAFYRNVARDRLDVLFGASQFILVGVSYASLHLGYYVDLTAPVTVGLAFYSAARFYAAAAERTAQARLFTRATGGAYGMVLLLRVEGTGGRLPGRVLQALRREIEALKPPAATVTMFHADHPGFWAVLQGSVAVTWVGPQPAAQQKVRALVQRLRERAPPGARVVASGFAQGPLEGPGAWRALLGQALQEAETPVS